MLGTIKIRRDIGVTNPWQGILSSDHIQDYEVECLSGVERVAGPTPTIRLEIQNQIRRHKIANK